MSRNAYRGKCALNEKFTLQAKLKGQVNQVISGEAITDGHSIWENFRVRFCKGKNTPWHYTNHLTVSWPGTKHLAHLFFHSSRLQRWRDKRNTSYRKYFEMLFEIAA